MLLLLKIREEGQFPKRSYKEFLLDGMAGAKPKTHGRPFHGVPLLEDGENLQLKGAHLSRTPRIRP